MQAPPKSVQRMAWNKSSKQLTHFQGNKNLV